MKEYIEKWDVVNKLTALENEFQQFKPFEGFERAMYRKLCDTEMEIGEMPGVILGKDNRVLAKDVGGNRIPYDKRKEIYGHALMVYGQQAQMVVAIEELSETQKELCKILRGKGDLEHLAEEIADATIMLEQMRYFLGLNEKVCAYMDEKIRRLDNMLEVGGS